MASYPIWFDHKTDSKVALAKCLLSQNSIKYCLKLMPDSAQTNNIFNSNKISQRSHSSNSLKMSQKKSTNRIENSFIMEKNDVGPVLEI
jgi:hypothetical protein